MERCVNRRKRKSAKPRDGKSGQVPIRWLSIESIQPSPENLELYRPVDPNDPDVVALAASIREHGIREPLVVSRDNFLLSGHRRLAAAKLAGLTLVPCRIEPIDHDGDHDQFVRLLREYNRQRVKTLDEQLREAVVETEPEEVYQGLLAYRQQRADFAIDGMQVLDLGARSRRAEISAAKLPMMNAIIAVLNERRDYWPISERVIHYALLNDPPLTHASKPDSHYQNNGASYKKLSDLATRMRISGVIPMECIDDETRPVVTWNVHDGPHTFLRKEIDGFLRGYWRDLMQSQPNHVEIVVEKNTVAKIVQRVAQDYCLPVTSGRGYCSLPPRYQMVQRYQKSGRDRLIILIASDFDPDGEMIAESFGRKMRDDFDLPLGKIDAIKVALTYQQTQQIDLPTALSADKKESIHLPKFRAKYGTDCYELEALKPETLQEIMRNAIERVIDREAFEYEIDQERADAQFLEIARQRALLGLRDMPEASP